MSYSTLAWAADRGYFPTFMKSTRPTPKILTRFVYPPIPDRSMDWMAWYEGEEDEQMHTGSGPTEAAAIADLTENYDPQP